MPYYHILVEIDDDERLEYDLSQDEMISILEFYDNDDVFMCDGSFVKPSEINRIKIYETDKPSKTYDDLYFNIERFSKDVTKLFIKHPPRKKGTERISKKEKTLKESRISSRNVFIVHGRDHNPMKELKVMLREFDLNPIVLHEQPSASRTIVEKLEKYSDVGYAFIILTPDDVGGSSYLTKEHFPIFKERARQNVILEFGYFMGLLSRDRVCCLHKGGVELPSDMHGIVYIPFKDSVEEARDMIVKELKEAGYEIRV